MKKQPARDAFATHTAFWPLRVLLGRMRLTAGVAAGLILGWLLPGDWPGVTRLLIAVNGGTLLFFALVAVMIARASETSMRARAEQEDEGRFLILLLATLAAAVSFGAIVSEMGIVKQSTGMARGLHLALVFLTIACAWTFVHLVFALHYAHEFYDRIDAAGPDEARQHGGLKIPGTDQPGYDDFLYFSFIIGVAGQTADIAITTRAMRRVSLAHSIIAFVFNATVLALAINIAASLL